MELPVITYNPPALLGLSNFPQGTYAITGLPAQKMGRE